ncbi:hypothetical protein D3C72_1169080 [compost metagenome]
MAQVIQRDCHTGQFADHLFGIVADIALALIVGQLHHIFLHVEIKLGAAKWVGQQQAITIRRILLPEEARVDFFLIGQVGERAPGLILLKLLHRLLMGAPLR